MILLKQMSRTFQYNLDHILPIVQMRYIPNPFEKLGVQLETSFLPDYSLDEAVIDYDFTFEYDVVMKSTEQLQSVFESQTCSNGTNIAPSNGEFDIPIEKLITDNYPVSTQEPHVNGNGSQLNIEGFDTQSTDPFQEAELKTINDMEELQTLIFPLAQLNPTLDNVGEYSTETFTLFDHSGGSSDQTENSYPINKQVTAQTTATNQSQVSETHLTQHESNDPTVEEPNTTYVNMDILPSIDALEIFNETCSHKPPVPAPRKIKGSSLIPPSSPTPQPRAITPKSTPRAKRLSTENPLTPPAYQQDRTEAVPELIEKNTNCVQINEYTHSLYPQVVAEEGSHLPINPSLELPTSQVPASVNNSFVVYDLTESILGDINRQINVDSVMAMPPPYQEQEGPLSEEEKLFRKIVDMGFHMESVKNISLSFNTKNESELIEYMLTIQNLSETNEWSPKVVETAFIFLKGEADKMKAYMETFLKYKEMGFEEAKIHSALAKCGKEYEKMLEILIEST